MLRGIFLCFISYIQTKDVTNVLQTVNVIVDCISPNDIEPEPGPESPPEAKYRMWHKL